MVFVPKFFEQLKVAIEIEIARYHAIEHIAEIFSYSRFGSWELNRGSDTLVTAEWFGSACYLGKRYPAAQKMELEL